MRSTAIIQIHCSEDNFRLLDNYKTDFSLIYDSKYIVTNNRSPKDESSHFDTQKPRISILLYF